MTVARIPDLVASVAPPVRARSGSADDRPRFADLLASGGGGADQGQFAGTPFAQNVECFNAHGLLANVSARALAAQIELEQLPAPSARAPDTILPDVQPLPATGTSPSGSRVPGMDHAIPAIGVPTRLTATHLIIACRDEAARLEGTATSMLPEMAPPATETMLEAGPSTALPTKSSHNAAKASVFVRADLAASGAAISVAIDGLGESETADLRADVIALLRRHGIVIDQLTINGRSTSDERPREQGS